LWEKVGILNFVSTQQFCSFHASIIQEGAVYQHIAVIAIDHRNRFLHTFDGLFELLQSFRASPKQVAQPTHRDSRTPNTTKPTTSCGFLNPNEVSGSWKRYAASTAEKRVANTPGPNPPSSAISMMLG
jgi:hypothetical protein